MNSDLSKYINDKYPDSKSDLFAVFMELDNIYLKNNGFIAMINQHSWMFLSSYEKLREKIIENRTIYNMVHLGPHTFEEIGGGIVQSTVFVAKLANLPNYYGVYVRVIDWNNPKDKELKFLIAVNNPTVEHRYVMGTGGFEKIPGIPIAYWASNRIHKIFNKGQNIGRYVDSFQGIITGDNEKFLRLWFEPSNEVIAFNKKSMGDIDLNEQYWIPYNKGGGFRRWYGNHEYVVYWRNGPEDKTRGKKSFERFYLKEYVSWSYITSSVLATRYFPNGFLWDVSGSGIFDKYNNLYYLQALIGSIVGMTILKFINPTMNYQVENILQIPIILSSDKKTQVDKITIQSINISKTDWDSFETSWDFKRHPLITFKMAGAYAWGDNPPTFRISSAFKAWSIFTEGQFNQLKANEEELNRIFIEIYGLQDELTPYVDDKDVTITRIYDSKEEIPESMKGNNYVLTREDVIKSFISYAVGCMFGRYSLDEEGLIYAGGDFDDKFRLRDGQWEIKTKEGWKKSRVNIVEHNVIPIADGDYFEDGILERFVDFVNVSFGEDTLEENLDYIAETLGRKANETSRQAIRRYFLKDFYKDHVKTYKKRPIYWLFDSGRQDGFKALIYMHRYDPSTVARVRTDYLHSLQKKYEAEINHLDILIDSDISQREKAAARKKKETILKQIEECRLYDEAIAHMANQRIEIDLDDGVKVNYAKFQGVEIPQGKGRKPLKADLLAKI